MNINKKVISFIRKDKGYDCDMDRIINLTINKTISEIIRSVDKLLLPEPDETYQKLRNHLSTFVSQKEHNNDFIKECKKVKCKHYNTEYDGNCSLDTNFACPFGHSFIKS